MAYTTQEGMATVGDFAALDVTGFLSQYKWYLLGAAVIAAAGVGYWYMKRRGGAVAEYDGLDDVSDCGCGQ